MSVVKLKREEVLSYNGHFDIAPILNSVQGRKIVLRPKENIYCQGDEAEGVYYIVSGRIKLTVTSRQGREGVIALFESGNFIGESCFVDPPIHTTNATAMTKTVVFFVKKSAILHALHQKLMLNDLFISSLVYRNKQIEANLQGHLFNSSEQRLALLLLQMAGVDSKDTLSDIPRISQEVIANTIGTTRSRVCYFMRKFHKLGYVVSIPRQDGKKGNLKVSSSLMKVILEDKRYGS